MVYGSKNYNRPHTRNGHMADKDIRHERYVKKYDKEMKERKKIRFQEIYPDAPLQDWEIAEQKMNEDTATFYQSFDNLLDPIKK